jgi:hypothetical protein
VSARVYPNAADLAPVTLAPLPANFDAMLRVVDSVPRAASADMAWLGHEARLNSAKGDGAEEDGAL